METEVEKSKTPITDAINQQFDLWEAQILEIKNGPKELAEEQLEKLKKDIEDWVAKKTEELTAQKESENPLDGLEAPTSVDDVVESVTKIVDALTKIAQNIALTIADVALAATTVPARSEELLAEIANPLPTGV